MLLDVALDLGSETDLYSVDPAIFPGAVAAHGDIARMGDIVRFGEGRGRLRFDVSAASPVERVDIFNGKTLLATQRPYSENDLGNRIRLLWEGATYRGRFRQVIWDGGLKVNGTELKDYAEIAFLNRDKSIARDGNSLSWNSVTTGNQSGVDLWLKDQMGWIDFETGPLSTGIDLSQIGYEDTVFDISGELPRFLRVNRLPDENPHITFSGEAEIAVQGITDAPIWVRVALEDGTRAWSSPIYLCPTPEKQDREK